MEVFSSLEKAIEKYPNSYVSHAQFGDCMVCGEYKDLRCGACFNCSGKVNGEPIKNKKGEIIGHRLWAIDNPDKKWIVGVA